MPVSHNRVGPESLHRYGIGAGYRPIPKAQVSELASERKEWYQNISTYTPHPPSLSV